MWSAGIKRGPTGVMGSSKDSQDTVDTLIADLRGAGLADFGPDHSTPLAEWLLSRQPRLVTDDHWKLIDEYERAVGEPLGRPPRQADQRRGDAADGRPTADVVCHRKCAQGYRFGGEAWLMTTSEHRFPRTVSSLGVATSAYQC